MVEAPRDEVFRAWTHDQAWPAFSVLYSRVTVTARDLTRALLDTDVLVRHGHVVGIGHPRGRTARRIEEHKLTPPERLEVTADTRGAISSSV